MMTNSKIIGLLRDTGYLRVWLVGVCSGVARWLELLVVGVYAYDTTGSPFLVALLVILRMLPLALLGSIIGTFADRLSTRLLLILVMISAMLAALFVFLIFAFGFDNYWLVAVSSLIAGIVWATDMPLRRRLLGDIAGLDRIAPAMSLDSATNNGTRMIGPLFGGILLQWLGPSGAFSLSALMYAACVLLLLGLPVSSGFTKRAANERPLFKDFKEVFSFIAADRDILRILLITVIFNVWGFPFISMIPVLGRSLLEINASWIGVLAGLEGAGALIGSLIIALGIPRLSFRQLYYFGLMGYLVFAFITGWMVSSIPMGITLFIVGLMCAGFTTMQSTLIYSAAPPEMRGRLFGVVVICIGTGLIGFANIGLMGELFGASTAIRIVALEGLIPLILIGLGWRQLRRR
ncbi:MAG: MFS transporter [Alphaproteobacteria bacterium]|nr:MFS transporter [Alphaproteobacteria bacterium]